MADKQVFGEVVAYVLTGIAFLLTSPILGPVVMYRNWNGYAEKYSRIPGISKTGGRGSAIATFVYVLSGTAVVGASDLRATGGLANYGWLGRRNRVRRRYKAHEGKKVSYRNTHSRY